MKYFVSIIIVSISLEVANAFDIFKNGQDLYLKSSCSEVSRILNSLSDWARSVGENKRCSAISENEIKRMDEDFGEDRQQTCMAKISDCVPEHVLTYHGSKPETVGPNCWNLALVMKNILPALRYSTAEEMAFYTQPPLCRQLTENEPRKVGDIGSIKSIYKTEVGEYHGFIYVSDDLAYSKNGSEEDSEPYLLQSYSEMLKTYQVPNRPECRRNVVDLKCSTALTFYRCQSMEEYLKSNPIESLSLRKSIHAINQFEGCLQQRIFSNQPLDGKMKDFLIDTTRILIESLKNERLKNFSPNQKDAFILGSLQLRLGAISEQLDLMNEDDFKADLDSRSFELQKIVTQSLGELKE